MSNDYGINVFINCPFDSDYSPLFEAILFTIYKCGYKPRCAQEHDDAGQIRIDKINDIILDCKYGIHDISRTALDPHNGLPRFNMPLELGLFLGCKRFSTGKHKDKICIIFDSERYRFQQFISDVAGQDIKSHENTPLNLITNLRNVFNTNNMEHHQPGARAIFNEYESYVAAKPIIYQRLNLSSEDELTYADHIEIIQRWLQMNS